MMEYAEEPPKKRKKADKKKKSKSKVSEAPLPPEVLNNAPLPPVPADSVDLGTDINPILPGNINDSGDSELELSTLIAESTQSSVDDCVLPTVPSLADMLSQSDICSSIASAGSSMDDEEANSRDEGTTADKLENSQVVIKSEPAEYTADLLNSSNYSANSMVTVCPQSADSSVANISDAASTAAPLEGFAVKAEPLCDPTATTQPLLTEQDELDAHAHDLLDSTSATSVTDSSQPVGESASKDDVGSADGNEGYVTMHRHIVKDVIPKSQYEELPEGWKELPHVTGMPVYIHLKTRVVTWSRPYFLADRYAKTHPVPVSAIPCMIYKRCREAMEKNCNTEENASEIPATAATKELDNSNQISDKTKQSSVEVKSEPVEASAGEVATPSGNAGTQSTLPPKASEMVVVDGAHKSTLASEKFADLDADAFMEYCKSIFVFEKMEFKKFNSWKVRKEYEKANKMQKKLEAGAKDPSMSPVVISVSEIPEQYQRDDKGRLKRDFYCLPGKNSVMDIYMTYATWLFRKAPMIEYNTTDVGFECVLKSKGTNIIHGIGSSATKKGAKEAAAINALESLVPKYAKRLLQNTISYNSENFNKDKAETALSGYYKIFDAMSITDERLVETAKGTNQIYPLPILKVCIARNFAMTESDIKTETTMDRKGRFMSIICDMTVGQFSVKGVKGKNIKLANHHAAQDILQQLHPHLKSWGSILRLYGTFAEGSVATLKQEAKNQLEITQIVSSREDKDIKPINFGPGDIKDEVCTSVLLKLKEQMKKVYKERQKKGKSSKKRKFDMTCTDTDLDTNLPLHNIQMMPTEESSPVATTSEQVAT